ncbi:MAG: transketolase C-terminal domain-containing protein [Myxococcota bacterium]
MKTILEAVREALDASLADKNVVLFGQDIGRHGGAFGATEGLLEKHGADRVVDMPVAEAALLGAACGAAMRGMKAIAELQFIDFASAAGFDQIVSVAAKSRYRTGVACPLVVRGPSGAGGRGGPFHSASPESWFVATPGLKIVAPSTPRDTYALLRAAVDDPDPVVFLEPKALYRRALDSPDHDARIGQAHVVRPGERATVLSYGAMVHRCLDAVDGLDADVGVIDLRTLWPLDEDTVIDAVRRTSRVLIVHEAAGQGGFAGELMALINAHAFDALDAPPMRLTGRDTPVPHAPVLEDAYLPSVESIAQKIEHLISW